MSRPPGRERLQARGDGRPGDEDPITALDPETQGSSVAEAAEEEANQPGRLVGTFLLFRDLWRLIRGERQRTRKLRWLVGLLRPYRGRVALTGIALVVATAAGLAPPTSPDRRSTRAFWRTIRAPST